MTADHIPSPGACANSLIHVLDATDGALHPDLRVHLEGVLRYVTAQEVAPKPEHVSSPMAVAWSDLYQWLTIETDRHRRLGIESHEMHNKTYYHAKESALESVRCRMLSYDLVVDDIPPESDAISLADLRDRLTKAADTLDTMRRNPENFHDSSRLAAKCAGVRLALDYLRDYDV